MALIDGLKEFTERADRVDAAARGCQLLLGDLAQGTQARDIALTGLQDRAQLLCGERLGPSSLAVHRRKGVEGKLDLTQ